MADNKHKVNPPHRSTAKVSSHVNTAGGCMLLFFLYGLTSVFMHSVVGAVITIPLNTQTRICFLNVCVAIYINIFYLYVSSSILLLHCGYLKFIYVLLILRDLYP